MRGVDGTVTRFYSNQGDLKMKMKLVSASAALLLFAGTAAMAQEAVTPETTGSVGKAVRDGNMSLLGTEADNFPVASRDEMYRGWRANELLDENVYGPNGNEIGEVEDIIIGTDGKILSIVVEGGGFLEIGDARWRIPWKDVTARANGEGVQVPMTEETAENFGLYDRPDWVATGPREFRLSELLGDRAVSRVGYSAGYINDAVFTQDGKLAGVLVNPGTRPYGLYAYPWYGYGYGWDPGLGYYALPVTDIDQLRDGATQVEIGRFGKVPFEPAG
jgi:sporulation protein YlmC with PRC-barrel domain